MKKRKVLSLFASILIAVGFLAGCGNDESNGSEENNQVDTAQNEESNNEEVENNSTDTNENDESSEEAGYGEAYQVAVTELAKAIDGEEVDYDKVMELYTTTLQPLVVKGDEATDQQLTTVLEAAKNGEMDGGVAKQLFDKLMQKVFFQTISAELREITDDWGNKELAEEELEEAKEFYAILKGTVDKRDNAYETNLADTLAGAFDELEATVESGDELAFKLANQVVHKTLTKVFYLATGALPNGYASKIASIAVEEPEKAKMEQAEAWAFYQAINGYIEGHSPENAEYILSQFDLENDVKNIDPEAINAAFVKGYAKIALDEYEESLETWGEDKSAITGLEGALFIDIIDSDLKRILGEEDFNSLYQQAQDYMDQLNADQKEEAEATFEKIKNTLTNDVINAL